MGDASQENGHSETRHESRIPDILNNKRRRVWVTPARWMNTERGQDLRSEKEGWDLFMGRLREYKSPGVPLLGVPLQRHQLKLFRVTAPWITCFKNKMSEALLRETRCQTGEETRSGCEWDVQGVKRGPIGPLELPAVKGPQSQHWQSLAVVVWLPEGLVNSQTGNVP